MSLNTHSATFVAASSQGKKTTVDFTDYGINAVTVECWVRMTTDNAACTLVGVNDTVAQTFQLIKHITLGFRFDIHAGGSAVNSDYIPEGNVEDGTWHHLAGTYDGSNVRIYLDGSEFGTGNAQTGNLNTSNPSPLGIAHRAEGAGDAFFSGQIDDVRVWNDVRTQTEIDDNKSVELVGNEAGLTLYAKLNNNNTEETGNYTISNTNNPTFTTDVPFAGTADVASNMLLMFP